eukprot:TRINITY_DN70594_c0_g1_i1.p1 TRINITY_DN70594_c0_g1~~TRINITY_DN70594_c0_g1_i1.p1  ORF type:complete len:436 (-),score=68.63 TRINITY_DN70594_c0_g1_i1:109-1416(-)
MISRFSGRGKILCSSICAPTLRRTGTPLAQFYRFASDSNEDLAAAHKNPIVRKLWEDRAILAKCNRADGFAQEHLLTKTPAESRVEVDYNFADNSLLKDQYASPWQTMRWGKLLEDLDALAGNVAFQHADDDEPATRMPVIVTASVDRIRLGPGVSISLDKNYVLSGRVIWVGRSSMKIRMELAVAGTSDKLLTSDFTFVARDKVTGKSHPINHLKVESDEEIKLFKEAEAAHEKKNQRRRQAAQMDITQDASVAAEAQEAMAREILEQGRLLEDMPGLAAGDAILHRQTKHMNTFMCYPQQRNTAGRIFGGFMMRQAYELAFSTAYKFAGMHPRFVEIGEVSFHKPVDVGDLVNLQASVMLTHTQVRPKMCIEVVASVLSPEEKSSDVTNTFLFQFELRPSKGQGMPRVKTVYPSTIGCARRAIAIMEKQNMLD